MRTMTDDRQDRERLALRIAALRVKLDGEGRLSPLDRNDLEDAESALICSERTERPWKVLSALNYRWQRRLCDDCRPLAHEFERDVQSTLLERCAYLPEAPDSERERNKQTRLKEYHKKCSDIFEKEFLKERERRIESEVRLEDENDSLREQLKQTKKRVELLSGILGSDQKMNEVTYQAHRAAEAEAENVELREQIEKLQVERGVESRDHTFLPPNGGYGDYCAICGYDREAHSKEEKRPQVGDEKTISTSNVLRDTRRSTCGWCRRPWSEHIGPEEEHAVVRCPTYRARFDGFEWRAVKE